MERVEVGLGVAGDRPYRVERGDDGGQQRYADSAADLPLGVEDRGRDAGPFRADGGEARGLPGNEYGGDAESRDEEDDPEQPRTCPGPTSDKSTAKNAVRSRPATMIRRGPMVG